MVIPWIKKVSRCAAFAMLLFLSACANQQYVIHPNVGVNEKGGITQTFWLWGAYQTAEIDAAAVCKSANRVTRVEFSTSLWQLAASVLTLGIYSPRTVDIRCLS